MKTKKLNFRSVVFQRAYRIVSETGCAFSAALAEAWSRYRAYRDNMATEAARAINSFDRHYCMSDDDRVYTYWSDVKIHIKMQIASMPKTFAAKVADMLNITEDIKSFIMSARELAYYA